MTTARRRATASGLAAAALAAGCGGGSPGAGGHDGTRLEFRSSTGAGDADRASLSCDPDVPRATGYFRGQPPDRLCAAAAELRSILVASGEHDGPCTLQYGGPDRVIVRGSVGGAPVDRSFSREHGCAIADWDAAQRLLPQPGGTGR